MSHSTDIEQRLRGENPEHCVVTDRLRANIGMPDTFQFDRDDAVELDELVLEAADELARLEADNASLRSRLEEVEGARDRERRRATDAEYMAVAVKPLEWEKKGRSGDYFAKTVVGRYEVGLVHTKFVTMLRAVDSVDADDFELFGGGGLEAAKAAAQADYASRIRSALVAIPPAEPVVEEQVKHMVQRFLQWELPKDFRPDGGISFDPIGNKGTKAEFERNPHGTNLLNHTQATAMVRQIMSGIPGLVAEPATKTLPYDLFTHRDAWRKALEAARDTAEISSPDIDDRSYWQHELDVFDRVFAALAAKENQNG